ncbi:MAG: MBL fold metallo-hydrolase [Eubacterium sp.]|nr:MBL fold metallo-hydrolase [Eubacterium sp.]
MRQWIKVITGALAAATVLLLGHSMTSYASTNRVSDGRFLSDTLGVVKMICTEDTTELSSEQPVEPETDGWHAEENGDKYYIENGARLVNVTRKIGSTWYVFDTAGIARAYVGTVIEPGKSEISSGNRVWFYNIAGGTFQSDFIIVESRGRWGLIDTGSRYADTIVDSDSTLYSVPWKYASGATAALSCQRSGRNGKDAAIYMIQTLGVKHLDFIITTHSHSDHVGGLPEIADIMLGDETGIHSLIDKDTICFTKKYYHVNDQNDDMGGSKDPTCWHNQAFHYQAVQAVKKRGGTVVDVSLGKKTSTNNQTKNDYSSVISAMKKHGLTEVSYSEGSYSDYFDDYLNFKWGSLTIRMYNLFTINGCKDENENSIATVIAYGNQQVFTSGDMNVHFRVQQKVAKAVYKSFGAIDLIKASDHGFERGFSKEHLDLFKPKYVVTTNSVEVLTREANKSFSAGMYYAHKKYGTVSYETSLSEKAIVAEFGGSGVTVKELCGVKGNAFLRSAADCKSTAIERSGWITWVEDRYDKNETNFMYFKANVAAKGWTKINESTYYFDEYGLMCKGWIKVKGKTYFLKNTGILAHGWLTKGGKKYYLDPKTGVMKTGWMKLNNKLYFFNRTTGVNETGWIKDGTKYYYLANGVRYVGWKKIGGDTYYFDEKGVMRKKWAVFDGKWYYFGNDGRMRTGWAQVGKKKCFFTAKGELVTGWKKEKNKTFYLQPDGFMAVGWRQIDSKWYYFDQKGVMRRGWTEVDKKWYYLDKNGVMMTGWISLGSQKYYLEKSGAMCTDWKQIGDKWYYFGTSGAMSTGTVKISKKTYTFRSDGVWVK